ncbi:hypothetical protein [Tenacibaculum phage Larrie]|nr:hypothetical protein [Tenacibaculum phage Larrie]
MEKLDFTKEVLLGIEPIEVKITPDILRGVDILNTTDCIGARALKSVLKNNFKPINFNFDVSWGIISGSLFCNKNGVNFMMVKFGMIDEKKKPVDAMSIEQPTTVYLEVDYIKDLSNI